MKIVRFETLFGITAIAMLASPALADVRLAPAPVAGIGIGAAALINVGYRALRRRIAR